MPYRYVLFYKPYNVLTQFGDRSVTETIDPEPAKPQPLSLKNFISIPEIYPVGRLDQDSEGLLLLTNDGELQHYLTDPKFQHPRTYWVQVEHQPKDIDLEPLRQGIAIRIQGKTYQTRPATVTLMSDEPTLPPRNPPIRFRKTVPTSWLEITLTEGRNRQVRRMTAAIGFPTLRLVRVAIAHLRLEGLEPGQWRDLTSEELKCLIEIRGKGKKMQHLLPHLLPRKRKTHG